MASHMSNFKDTLFATVAHVKPFEFNRDVAQVFDEMALRSIPFYHETQERIFEILHRLPVQPKKIYDLGTSTGSLLFFLSENFNDPQIHMIGVDQSEAMIEKAQNSSQSRLIKNKIEFKCADILNENFHDADVIVLNYVLQFISPSLRLSFLEKLYNELKPGGVLILSEKTQSTNPIVSKVFSDCHDAYRLKKHYSHLEIAQKRKALENILISWSLKDNVSALEQAGFKGVEPFLVWHNFASIVALKK